jgi:hypothetical protein
MARIAGQNVMHQAPPTAKGSHFITLEDENRFMNVIVRSSIYIQYHKTIRHLLLQTVDSKVQREGAVTISYSWRNACAESVSHTIKSTQILLRVFAD